MYDCELCGLIADEQEDLADFPNPNPFDEGGTIRLCRTCARATFTYADEYFDDGDDEDLDPIFIEEIFGTDEEEFEDE